MISNYNQQYVTIDILKTELGEIRYNIRSGFAKNEKEFKEIRTEIQTVRDIALVNSAKIDAYRDFSSFWFSILTIIVAIIGFAGTLAPMFREMYKEAKQNKIHDNMTEVARKVMHDEINSAVHEAINKLRGNSSVIGK